MKIKTQFLSPDEIVLRANDARERYQQRYDSKLPFNAERLLETGYGMQIVPIPGLKRLNIECSLSRDGKTILVDMDDYNSTAMDNRLCFTFAHELGHVILHERYLSVANDLTDQQFEWLEKQARMFAAEFLMPEKILLGVVASEVVGRIASIAQNSLTLERCADFRVPEMAKYFGVSENAMRNRLKNIDFSKVLNSPYISLHDELTLTEVAKTVAIKTTGVWVASAYE